MNEPSPQYWKHAEAPAGVEFKTLPRSHGLDCPLCTWGTLMPRGQFMICENCGLVVKELQSLKHKIL
jgi:hypothetical protein